MEAKRGKKVVQISKWPEGVITQVDEVSESKPRLIHGALDREGAGHPCVCVMPEGMVIIDERELLVEQSMAKEDRTKQSMPRGKMSRSSGLPFRRFRAPL